MAIGGQIPRLGQFIASSPTVFPAEYVKEFQACPGPGPSAVAGGILKVDQTGELYETLN